MSLILLIPLIALSYIVIATCTWMVCEMLDVDDDPLFLIAIFWPIGLPICATVKFALMTIFVTKRLVRILSAPFKKMKLGKGMLAKGVPSPTYTLCAMLAIRMVKFPASMGYNRWSKDRVVIQFDSGYNHNDPWVVKKLTVDGEEIDLKEHPDAAEELVKAREKCEKLNKVREAEQARIAAEKKSTDAIEHLLNLDPPTPKPHIGTYETPCTLSCCKNKNCKGQK